MKFKDKIKNNLIYIIAFFIPWILIIVHSLIRHTWPIFDGSILRGDAKVQYYYLYVELWNKVHSGQSLFYSWNAGDGFDFFLNFAYYLISPFALLIIAVPKSWLADTVQVVIVLKWSLIYVSMVYFFSNTRYNRIERHKKEISFILGSVVAMSNCIISYLTFPNWLDVIFFFPFLLISIEKMIDEKKWIGYCILLSVTILCNFYMAYEVCIFLVIWFLMQIESKTTEKLKKSLIFVGSSVLAALISSITILPCIWGVSDRYSATDGTVGIYIRSIIVNIWETITKLFVTDDISDVFSHAPNMYFSVGAVTLLVLYLGISSKDKVKNIIVGLFLLSGIFVGALSYIWHGFSIPHGVYHRFLWIVIFMFSFILLDFTQNINTIDLKWCAVSGAFELLIAGIAIANNWGNSKYYVYIITLSFFTIYQLLLFFFYGHKIKYTVFLTIFSIVIMGELITNSLYQLKEYERYSIVDNYETNNAMALSELIESDYGERMNVMQGGGNVGLLFNKPSDGIFLSYSNGKNNNLHSSLGMAYNVDSSYELYGASPLINLMFNLRYGIGDGDYLFSDSEKTASQGRYSLYRTKRLAGLGYMVSEDVKNWTRTGSGPFDLQNRFAEAATGETPIFEIVMPEVEFSDVYGNLIEADEVYREYGFYAYEFTEEAGQNMTDMEMKVPKDMDLYITIKNGMSAISRLSIDDVLVYRDTTGNLQETIHVGEVMKGQRIKIESYRTGTILGNTNYVWFQFGSFQESVYQNVYEKLSKNIYRINKMNSAYISGEIYADEDGIMMTSVQAADGFEVYVDNNKVSYLSIGDTFIGVPLGKGKHMVEFYYTTPYFKAGIIGSVCGVCTLLLLCIMQKLYIKKEDISEI